MATDTLANASNAGQQTQAFLTFLRGKFDDEEAYAFYETFAITMQGRNDEFCIDLDEAFPWLGYTRKSKAVALITKLEMREGVDFLLPRSGQHRKTDVYMLKTASFKKLLLAARTEKSKKAADYFIKIEEAIPEFCRRDNQAQEFQAQDLERRVPHRNLAIEQFTQVYDPEKNPIVSAGYHDVMEDPQVYIGIVKNMRFVAGTIPEGACVLSFGHTSSAAERLRDHQQKNGEYTYIDHLPCAASYELEQQIKRLLIVMERLKVGRRLNDSKDYETFVVYDQADYVNLISLFWKKRQEMMDAICKMHGRSMDLAIAKETTKQVVAQAEARKTEAEARKAEAEARKAEAEARKAEAVHKAYLQEYNERAPSSVVNETVEGPHEVLVEEPAIVEQASGIVETPVEQPLNNAHNDVAGEPIQTNESTPSRQTTFRLEQRRLNLSSVDLWLINRIETSTLPSIVRTTQIVTEVKRNDPGVTSNWISYRMKTHEGRGSIYEKRITFLGGEYKGRGPGYHLDASRLRTTFEEMNVL